MPKTNAQRQKDLRNKRRLEGWKRIWIKPEWEVEIKKIIKKLKNKDTK